VTVHDALFTEEDLDTAKAKKRNDAELCPGPCGLPLSETSDPNNQGEYIVPEPTRCFACTELEREQERLAKRKIKPGALIHVERGPGVTQAQA
jgi:hypothetical protein